MVKLAVWFLFLCLFNSAFWNGFSESPPPFWLILLCFAGIYDCKGFSQPNYCLIGLTSWNFEAFGVGFLPLLVIICGVIMLNIELLTRDRCRFAYNFTSVTFGKWLLLCFQGRNNLNQGRRRLNGRAFRAQRDDSIRRTVYVSDIDQTVSLNNHTISGFLLLFLADLENSLVKVISFFVLDHRRATCRLI